MYGLFLGIEFNPDQEIEIFNDNMQTIRSLTKQDPIIKTKLRHVDIYQHWLRESVKLKEIKVSYVNTNNMIVDRMTKSFGKQKHSMFLGLLNLVNLEDTSGLN